MKTQSYWKQTFETEFTKISLSIPFSESISVFILYLSSLFVVISFSFFNLIFVSRLWVLFIYLFLSHFSSWWLYFESQSWYNNISSIIYINSFVNYSWECSYDRNYMTQVNKELQVLSSTRTTCHLQRQLLNEFKNPVRRFLIGLTKTLKAQLPLAVANTTEAASLVAMTI